MIRNKYKFLFLLITFFSMSAHAEVKNVYLVQSVVWEGSPLAVQKIESLNKLRAVFPNEPITHFISSSYFLRSKEERESNKNIIQSHIKSMDIVGLHLTAWKSEVEASGLIFRDAPTFFGNKLHPTRCLIDCGQEIPPSSYPNEELKALISHSKKTLVNEGYSIDSLHVQGWMATHQLLKLAREEGFVFDYSGVSPQIVESRLYQYPIFPWIRANWDNKPALQQPYFIQSKAGQILEVGNFMASIDYSSATETFDRFKQLINLSESENTTIFHISLRMESSFEKVDTFIDANRMIRAYCEQNNIVLVPYAIKSFQEMSKKFKTYSAHEHTAR